MMDVGHAVLQCALALLLVRVFVVWPLITSVVGCKQEDYGLVAYAASFMVAFIHACQSPLFP